MTSNRNQKAQRWVLEMLEHAETAAALDGFSAEDAFEIGVEAKRLAEILRSALTKPAAAEPVYQVEFLDKDGGGCRWYDVDRATMELRKTKPQYWRTRILWTAPPVAAHGDEIESLAVNRYRPTPDGLLHYKVVAGDGRRSLFTGTKAQCYLVAAKLTEAFLDGAYVQNSAAHGDEAVRKDAERYAYLRDMTEGLDATVDAMIAENAAMRAQAGEGGE